MIPVVNTKFFIKELDTEGHYPVLFLCDDDCKYYSKYLPRFGEERFLLYELIGTVLCNHHNIPTPEIALVNINGDSFRPKDIPHNRKRMKPGVVCFGSKQVEGTDLFNELFIPETKHDFNQFINPADLIKMALLDLWMVNTDRKDGRYNFIFKNESRGKMIYSIDHAFSFGGVKNNHFAPHDSIFSQETLISSQAMNVFLKHIEKEQVSEIIEEFVYLCNDESKSSLLKLFQHIPPSWGISDTLKDRIVNFLFNTERLKKLKLCTQQSLLRP